MVQLIGVHTAKIEETISQILKNKIGFTDELETVKNSLFMNFEEALEVPFVKEFVEIFTDVFKEETVQFRMDRENYVPDFIIENSIRYNLIGKTIIDRHDVCFYSDSNVDGIIDFYLDLKPSKFYEIIVKEAIRQLQMKVKS